MSVDEIKASDLRVVGERVEEGGGLDGLKAEELPAEKEINEPAEEPAEKDGKSEGDIPIGPSDVGLFLPGSTIKYASTLSKADHALMNKALTAVQSAVGLVMEAGMQPGENKEEQQGALLALKSALSLSDGIKTGTTEESAEALINITASIAAASIRGLLKEAASLGK